MKNRTSAKSINLACSAKLAMQSDEQLKNHCCIVRKNLSHHKLAIYIYIYISRERENRWWPHILVMSYEFIQNLVDLFNTSIMPLCWFCCKHLVVRCWLCDIPQMGCALIIKLIYALESCMGSFFVHSHPTPAKFKPTLPYTPRNLEISPDWQTSNRLASPPNLD